MNAIQFWRAQTSAHPINVQNVRMTRLGPININLRESSAPRALTPHFFCGSHIFSFPHPRPCRMNSRSNSRTRSKSLTAHLEHYKEHEDDSLLAAAAGWSASASFHHHHNHRRQLFDADDATHASGYPILLEAMSSSAHERAPKRGRSKMTLQEKESTKRKSNQRERSASPSTGSVAMRVIPWSEDRPHEMTYARRIALRLMKYKWYYPKADSNLHDDDVHGKFISNQHDDDADLAKAWEHLEHCILPRHFYDRSKHRKKEHIPLWTRVLHRFQKSSQTFERAPPGESYRPTKLYSPLFTPLSQLADFGVGFGLFFSMQQALIFFTFLAGVMNIPNIAFYASDSYSQGQNGVPFVLKGTAICTNVQWVPCPDCSESDFSYNRIATGIHSGTGVSMPFALRNFCNGARLEPAMVNFGTMCLMLFGILLLAVYQKGMELQFREDEQTTQDYSIIIKQPPPDAFDPEEWKSFFEQFEGVHVTCCTVAIDNDALIRALVQRREIMSKLKLQREKKSDMSDVALARLAVKIEKERNLFQWLWSFVIPGIPELLAHERVLTFRIQGLAQDSYPVRNVFVSFETEEAKHRVLEALTVPSVDVRTNNPRNLADRERLMFRGTVLHVDTPPEPSSLRWQDLNASVKTRFTQIALTTSIFAGVMVFVAFIVKKVHDDTLYSGAYVIAAANGAFPAVAKFLTKFEYHVADCDKQTSLYLKIGVSRWFNTVVLISIISPFTDTVSNDRGLIYSVAGIFLAELVFTTGTRLLDPVGQFKRHILAPRAKNQDMMNVHMQGQEVHLAELYTDMTKVLFLAFWYCAIFPSAYFLCALTLSVKFFADRFGVMRSWKRAAQVGGQISRFSRHYFLTTAFCALAIVSGYFFAEFPFDNLCETDNVVLTEAAGDWTVTSLIDKYNNSSSEAQTVTIGLQDVTYQYCKQNFLRTPGRRFPPIPQYQYEDSQWMTPDQEIVSTIYGWTGVGVLAIVLFVFAFHWTARVTRMFHDYYETKKVDQGIPFSRVECDAYIPQVHSSMFPHPLIACNSENLDEHLFGWTDPDRLHVYYDLSQDVDYLCGGGIGHGDCIFSSFMHWPPEQNVGVGDEQRAVDLQASPFC